MSCGGWGQQDLASGQESCGLFGAADGKGNKGAPTKLRECQLERAARELCRDVEAVGQAIAGSLPNVTTGVVAIAHHCGSWSRCSQRWQRSFLALQQAVAMLEGVLCAGTGTELGRSTGHRYVRVG